MQQPIDKLNGVQVQLHDPGAVPAHRIIVVVVGVGVDGGVSGAEGEDGGALSLLVDLGGEVLTSLPPGAGIGRVDVEQLLLRGGGVGGAPGHNDEDAAGRGIGEGAAGGRGAATCRDDEVDSKRI